MEQNLDSLVSVLEAGFKKIDQNPNMKGNLIIPIGNTGCGKSTLLYSLAYGPESLKT